MTEPFVAPFRGMFQFDAVASGDRTLDLAALVALIGWTLIYALIMAILRLADRCDETNRVRPSARSEWLKVVSECGWRL